ncbi:hypothetical protein ROHU_023948 [Labeo rohita]|uniref:Uncharacterized protein n=1 Tax=Labeo rohita TaxID=84645 RepID=A0A498MKA3_LABRO|nr:hypothetical protein ROHU_023948 [Labeo rohita]
MVGDPHGAACQPSQRPPGEPHSSSPIQHGQPRPDGPTPTQPAPPGPKAFQIGHLLAEGSRLRARCAATVGKDYPTGRIACVCGGAASGAGWFLEEHRPPSKPNQREAEPGQVWHSERSLRCCSLETNSAD